MIYRIIIIITNPTVFSIIMITTSIMTVTTTTIIITYRGHQHNLWSFTVSFASAMEINIEIQIPVVITSPSIIGALILPGSPIGLVDRRRPHRTLLISLGTLVFQRLVDAVGMGWDNLGWKMGMDCNWDGLGLVDSHSISVLEWYPWVVASRWATKKNLYFPLCWLVNRDPLNGLFYNPYKTG